MRYALVACLVAAAPALAQELDLSITDPLEIAAQCGGDAGAGQILFHGCAACHDIGPEAEHGPGPHLQELFGRTAGRIDGWDFGPELVAAGGNGMIWERETLHALLADPVPMMGGTPHPVIAGEQDRNDLLTYLRTNTQPPPPAIGEVEIPEAVLAMEGDIAYGEYLASECAGCHVSGGSTLPDIAGRRAEDFITLMYEYKMRARDNETMRIVASRLGDEEIAALAAYFEGAD